MGKTVRVTDSNNYTHDAGQGLEGRLLAREVATEAKPPRTNVEMAERAAEIYAMDKLIAAKKEEVKALQKTREDLVQSLLIGCANATQTNLLDDLEAQA